MSTIVKKTCFSRQRKQSLRFALLIVALPMLQFIIFWGYVNFDSILMAFKDVNNEWSLWNFKHFYEDYQKGLISTAMKNSLIHLAVSQFIALPLVVLLAYFLYKKCFGASVFRVLFFLPSLISAIIMASLFVSLVSPNGDPGPVLTLLQKLGFKLDDTILRRGFLDVDKTAFATIEVYCIWTGVGTNLVLLCGGLSRAPQELFEAAKMDGANMWHEFKDIVVPVLWPTITTLFIFNLASCFTMYLPVMLLAENNQSTLTIGYFIIQRTTEAGEDVAALGYPAAVGLIFTVVTVPAILFVKWAFNKISEAIEF